MNVQSNFARSAGLEKQARAHLDLIRSDEITHTAFATRHPPTHLVGAEHGQQARVQGGVIEARGQIEQQRQLVVEVGVRLGGDERGQDVDR